VAFSSRFVSLQLEKENEGVGIIVETEVLAMSPFCCIQLLAHLVCLFVDGLRHAEASTSVC
jgi:hypothetical protein